MLLQANRNGFLYVLDRLDGKMLMATPLVKKLTWAKEILPNGKPVMNPNQVPTAEGTLICPAVEGAANFFSTSYNPATRLFYVNTLERCAVYSKRTTEEWAAGRGYQGGGGRPRSERQTAEDSSRLQHRNRQASLGASARRAWRYVDGHAFHRRRSGDFRR
jgi:alcohol dehydrogenase (cytochrome c)